MSQKIRPFLWFDGQAEAAANLSVSLFSNSKITNLSRYSETGSDKHRWTPDAVMVVAFELDGQSLTALNRGPNFPLTEASPSRSSPSILVELLSDPDAEKSERAMAAMLHIKKLDIAQLKRASTALSLAFGTRYATS